MLDSDWAIILVVVALIVFFGGSKLPKLFHSLGSAQAEYKKGLADAQSSGSTSGVAAEASPPNERPSTGA
ncbi:MAG: twin-arginine translocase TatA/TatE family subunit [Actinomycetota bacterium]|nr:twin-arginine translocase TatA/TatE family subunit [Actinomycetota bacterium]